MTSCGDSTTSHPDDPVPYGTREEGSLDIPFASFRVALILINKQDVS